MGGQERNIVIVNFRTGNLFSVLSAVRKVSCGKSIAITDDPNLIVRAERIILPGQGHAGCCLGVLNQNHDLKEALLEALRLKPVLGICVGQQLLCSNTAESSSACLGPFQSDVRALRSPNIIPHVGWREVWFDRPHTIWKGVPIPTNFYFSHSYYVCSSNNYSSAHSFYGPDILTTAASKDNIITTQFHPEKSSYFGAVILQNFLRWKP
ncbi:imidazole glycerol phosphate synthase, subunit HisH [Candidatus Tremblaya phenacola PAVE]|nr:imidazole glycerol phosphate synthase, subunit HisH [Candidatus Tremblaya phenacola PAVE]